MKSERKEQLKGKGWSEDEIEHAEQELEKAASHDVHFSKIIFWSSLVVIIFGNLLVSLVLIPFLIVFSKWMLYSVVILLAATIGFLYSFLVKDIGHLKKKHHISAGIIIPLIALANMVMMVLFSNKFIKGIKINTEPHNPWLVAIIFAVAFIVPYVISQIREYLQERKRSVIVH